jgi:hypothetical protein
MTKAMKLMMNLMKASVMQPAMRNKNGKKSYKNIKPHLYASTVDKKHPLKAESKCWELETNKFSCLPNWKSTQST